jgi:hypothetical protein
VRHRAVSTAIRTTSGFVSSCARRRRGQIPGEPLRWPSRIHDPRPVGDPSPAHDPRPVRDHMSRMPDDTPSEILGSLPRTRPHRRSEKRGGRAEASAKTKGESPTTGETAAPAGGRPEATSRASKSPKSTSASRARPVAKRQPPRRRTPSEPLRQPEQPSGTPPAPRARRPIPASGTELLSTVVQATAELAEIGLSVSARAVRNALGRLPRP